MQPETEKETKKMKHTLSKADLRQFTGSEHWYRHGLARNVLFTDGAKYVADTAGAYWLLDEIALAQSLKRIAAEEFQLWTLKVNLAEQTASLRCEDGNGNLVLRKRIEYTDFPLEEIAFYCINKTILLPSEY
jgi:prepilin-type processing-associated H-X9-DG protein